MFDLATIEEDLKQLFKEYSWLPILLYVVYKFVLPRIGKGKTEVKTGK